MCDSTSKKSVVNKQHPKMIFKNGIIDWDESVLDGDITHGIISRRSTFVAYSLGDDDANDADVRTVGGTTNAFGGGGGNASVGTKNRASSASAAASQVGSVKSGGAGFSAPLSLGATIFCDEAVIQNRIMPSESADPRACSKPRDRACFAHFYLACFLFTSTCLPSNRPPSPFPGAQSIE